MITNSQQSSAPPPRPKTEPTWSRPNQVQRQMIRTRFMLTQNVGLLTNILIAINVVAYIILAILSKSLTDISTSALVLAGAQNTIPLIQETGQYWRIFTAMFLHFNIFHIALNMLSLYFVGRAIEVLYGPWRYLVIYLGAGIAGGICTFFLQPDALAAGASGAIFGLFGALGVFYIVNRRALGTYGRGALTNWVFWLGLNLVFSFAPGIALYDHLGGLICGALLSFILLPRLGRRRYN